MRRKAIDDFRADLYKVFELDESGQPTEGDQLYSPNPYAQQLVNPTNNAAAYSADAPTELPTPLKRRRRAVANFSHNGNGNGGFHVFHIEIRN